MTANGSSHSGVLRQFDARQADDARAKAEVVRPNFRCVEIADWCYWNKRALRGQKIVLQEFRGKSAKPFEPEFEQPTHEDIVRAKEAGLKLPAWAEEALAAEGG